MTDDSFDKISPEFAQAFIKAQGSIEGAKKGKKNLHFNSKYAGLASCWDACRDALQENSIGVLQFPSSASVGHVGLTTALVFGPTGEMLSAAAQVPFKDPTSPQAYGSTLTYARRYQLCSIVGICPEDDDGNAGGQTPKPNKAQVQVDSPADAAEPFTIQSLKQEFSAYTNNADRKRLYNEVKSSSISEPNKTMLLKSMAEVIKANG